MRCPGPATSISDCDYNNWGVNDCDHTEDVTLVCGDDTGEANDLSRVSSINDLGSISSITDFTLFLSLTS